MGRLKEGEKVGDERGGDLAYIIMARKRKITPSRKSKAPEKGE